jgi:transmembrane sensor
MSNDRLRFLLEQYEADVSDPAETKELFGWIKKSKDDALLKDKINELWSGYKIDNELPDVDWNTIYAKIINTPVIGKRAVWPRIAAAVVIILLLSAVGYSIFTNHFIKQVAKTEIQKPFKNDVAPGGNKAILTLANGTQIILDSAANGALTQQGNTKIIKLDSGRLSYNTLNAKPGEVLYNTVSTPRGGQYQVVLADGSKVWLNAASSLRFPICFTGKERNVELTGEGYFEIAHNKAMPFYVKSGDMTVEVLGTHFDINAYSDESVIKTTLLEGSVKVSITSPSTSERVRETSEAAWLKPGEQAQFSLLRVDAFKVQKIDVDAAIAWKNGRFIFQGNNIQSVMRQLARWYDIDVSYQGNVTTEEFVGVIDRSRYENISKILEMLEKTRTVSFAINGRSVKVMPFKK